MVTKRTRNVAIIAVVYFLVAAGILGLCIQQVFAAGRELHQQSVAIANNALFKQKYTELNKLLEGTSVQRQRLNGYLLTHDATVNFLSDIEQIARTQGVTFDTRSLSVDDKKKNETFQTLTADFSLEGSKEKVVHVVQVLETLPYHSTLTKFSIIRETGNTFSATVELSISLLPSS